MSNANNHIIQLAKGWKWTKLGDVAEVNPKLPNRECIEDDLEVQFLPMKLVEELSGKIHLTETRLYGEVKKGYTPFIDSDVIFAKVTPCMENGKIAVVENLKNKIGFGSSEFHVVRSKEEILNKYAFYFLIQQRFRNDGEHAMTGAVGLRRVPKQFIENYKVPIPLISEQKAIVSKIEELFSELDKGIEELKTAQQQLKVYRKAVLKWAFEGKLTNENETDGELPQGWVMQTLDRVGSWRGGGTPSKSRKEFWENGDILWVSPKDMKSKIIHDTIDKITKEAVEGSTAQLIPKGSILFVVRSGILRRTLPVAITICEVTINQDLKALTPKEVIVDYIFYFVQSKNDDMRRSCSKDGTTVESIETSLLKNYKIPICTTVEQQQIVHAIESRLSVCDKIEETMTNSLKQAEALRQSILKKAFEGKLV